MSRGQDNRQRERGPELGYDFMGRPVPPPREDTVGHAQRGDGPAATDRLSGSPAPRQSAGRPVTRLLASRTALRQAILLAEIIGPPKALRRPDGT